MYTIIAEHKDFLVVDKHPEVSIHNESMATNAPSSEGMSHAVVSNKEIGLVQRLRADFNTPHIYPVHRLDKPTSGLLLCAKTSAANSQLSQLFQKKQIEKYYLAISNQKPKKKQGLIAGDMERTRNGNWKLTTGNKNPALTQFLSFGLGVELGVEKGKRLFILKPYTGKTHQLRVALKSIGSPITGDTRYAPVKDHSERTHLHAYCLRFRYADKDYHFQSLPSGGDFNEGVVDYINTHLNKPWTLSWPALPKKYLQSIPTTNTVAVNNKVNNKLNNVIDGISDNMTDTKIVKETIIKTLKTNANAKAQASLNNTTLVDAIQCVVDITSEPLSEYQLIQTLNQQGWEFSINAADSLMLFTSHFLVFNALYRLQIDYWQKQQRYLAVSALSIYLHPKNESGNDKNSATDTEGVSIAPYAADAALRDYYLDATQLEAATENSVNKLLSQFWERYIATDESSEALQLFSLEHPATQKEIKQRYRILAMEHHPDRGGKPEIFQKVNWAFGVLQRVYF